MDRFFIDKYAKLSNIIDNKDDVKHISKVLRLKQGNKIEIVDKNHIEYIAEIETVDKDSIGFNLIEEVNISRELPVDINLYQGIPKGQKLDTIVQKATELGIRSIIPVSFKRCVAEIKGEKEDKKLQRLNRVAYEASKQSKRTQIPVVEASCSFKAFKESIKKNDLNIVFYENHRDVSLKSFLSERDLSTVKSIGVIIGPEGGFAPEEIKEIEELDISVLSLGNRILRTETAAIAALAIISNEFN
ncbi:16S rRNA (uracil1498-N3)-methyltransferase [Acetoanaerobium pronyense]|uniref:Ribosomal RNA small subunit methyltransferase E n=1 Tax=Acetoanaerobium pronyense TaxID=1482736 RepID=A0ABS4KEX3_9FIRM|nr:16S rRNA (uracil(1498)-N(3))-methyltransferase [Acetoanaerobium pronyense]MBP2026322.1 16S rRNA (uracil1498-N3)-methyltransferase [Acetoanaerobium pronyense]